MKKKIAACLSVISRTSIDEVKGARVTPVKRPIMVTRIYNLLLLSKLKRFINKWPRMDPVERDVANIPPAIPVE